MIQLLERYFGREAPAGVVSAYLFGSEAERSAHRLRGRIIADLSLSLRAPAVAAAVAATGLTAPAAAEAQLPEYSLEPTLRIGSLDDPETALGIVTQLAPAHDGRIAVAHTGPKLWLFSPTGERLHEVGREGQGPGEYQAASSLGWHGDTLWIGDGSLYRVTFVVPGEDEPEVVGGPGRQIDGSIRRPPRPSPDDRWIHYRRWILDPRTRAYREEVWSVDENWEPVEPLAELPEGPDELEIELGRDRTVRREHPFAQHPLYTPAPDNSSLTIVRRDRGSDASDEVRYTVTRVAASGDTVFHHEHAVDPEPVTDEALDRIVEEHVADERLQAGAGSASALRDAVLAGLDAPEAHPPVTRVVVVGADGRTWLRGPDDRSGTVRWTVLDQTGEPVFAVHTRRELGMFEGHVDTQNMVRVAMAGDTVWGVERDDFDVEYVVRYELRPASGGRGSEGER